MRPYSNAAGWSEVKFYVFTGEQDGHGVQWVGDHIRPRIRVPDSCNWPVGVSLPTEVGFQRAVYSPDTWTWEIRPIIDNPIGRWYFAINPALAHLARPDVNQGLGFSLNIKISYDFTRGQRRASGPMRDEAGGRPGLSQRPIACLRHRRPPAGMISSVKRDRALLLVGWASCGRRRSEIVAVHSRTSEAPKKGSCISSAARKPQKRPHASRGPKAHPRRSGRSARDLAENSVGASVHP